MDKKTSENIYAVRGLGALLIMIYHYSVYYEALSGTKFFQYFQFSYLTVMVPVFFVFSALFLYEKAICLLNPLKLVIYRMTRLFPMYWVAVLFSSAIILISGESISEKQVVFNLMMIEKVFGVEQIDGVYWTMFYEIILLMMLSLASVIKVKKKIIVVEPGTVCGSWLFLGVVAALIMKVKKIESSTVAVLLFGYRYVPVFIMGILFYDRYIAVQKHVGDCGFFLFYVTVILYELFLEQNIHYGVQGIVAILIAHLTISGKLVSIPIFTWKPLISMGKISYGVYLCHNIFGRVLISKLGAVQQKSAWITLLCILCISTAAIFIAAILSKVEKVLMRALSKLTAPLLKIV